MVLQIWQAFRPAEEEEVGEDGRSVLVVLPSIFAEKERMEGDLAVGSVGECW